MSSNTFISWCSLRDTYRNHAASDITQPHLGYQVIYAQSAWEVILVCENEKRG